MSWLYSQVLVEEYLGENFSDGEQSAPLSGNPTPQAYLSPDKMMDFSRLSLFGMTFAPLTANLGAELLMSYLEDFHALTSAQREKARESMEKIQDSGEKWRASFVKYDPDSSLWRTHQCSLLGDLDEFLETWPQWGLMQDGECWEQQTLAQTISVTAFGLLLNPMENQSPPTPPHWPTPTAHMSKETNAPSEHNRNTPTLTAQVNYPTPTMQGLNGGSNSRKSAIVKGNWPTPRTAGMCGGTGSWDLLKKNTTIEEARAMGAGNGGKLNPMWVEWLMGWPLGWTDLRPLEMDKSHFVPQQHGEL